MRLFMADEFVVDRIHTSIAKDDKPVDLVVHKMNGIGIGFIVNMGNIRRVDNAF
jgi:hypothetical protein